MKFKTVICFLIFTLLAFTSKAQGSIDTLITKKCIELSLHGSLFSDHEFIKHYSLKSTFNKSVGLAFYFISKHGYKVGTNLIFSHVNFGERYQNVNRKEFILFNSRTASLGINYYLNIFTNKKSSVYNRFNLNCTYIDLVSKTYIDNSINNTQTYLYKGWDPIRRISIGYGLDYYLGINKLISKHIFFLELGISSITTQIGNSPFYGHYFYPGICTGYRL